VSIGSAGRRSHRRQLRVGQHRQGWQTVGVWPGRGCQHRTAIERSGCCAQGGRQRRRLRGGVVELGRALLAAGVAAFADHLLLDLVDLGLDAGVHAYRGAVGDAHLGVVDARRVAQRRQLLGRQTLAAHLAQHVELALANEIVAPLALDHRLELGLLEVEFAAVVLARIQVGPIGGRIGHEAHDLAEEALVLGLLFGHDS
jgi:hypothetical protein